LSLVFLPEAVVVVKFLAFRLRMDSPLSVMV